MTGASASASRARLLAILAESVQQARYLHTALEAERAALDDNDADALGRATEAKAGPVSKLAELESERSTAIRQAGLAPGADMDAVIGWCDEGDAVAAEWRRLLDAARECERHNATNGAIIRLRRQQVSAGLAVLRGGEFNAETYAASGIEAHTAGGRALARA